jgi:hypothetical protein
VLASEVRRVRRCSGNVGWVDRAEVHSDVLVLTSFNSHHQSHNHQLVVYGKKYSEPKKTHYVPNRYPNDLWATCSKGQGTAS